MQEKKARGELKCGFGFWTGFFVVIASMVGSGILTNSGPVLRSTGNYSTLFFLWTLGGLIALAGALTMGELASGLPRVGGDYVFVREAFGPAFGFVYGWAMFVVGFAAPIALVSFTASNYLYPAAKTFIGHFPLSESPRIFSLILSSVLILFFTASHCLSHRHSSWVQSGTTLFNFLLLVGFACLGMVRGTGDFSHLREGTSFTSVPFSSLASGLILVMYAYSGWNGAVYLAGEIRNPAKTLPRCLIFGCAAVTGLYLVVNFTYAYALSPEAVSKLSSEDANRLAEVAFEYLLGPTAAQVFSFLVSLGTLAALSAFILTGPRIAFAMAKDGLFPKAALYTSESGVPIVATLIQGSLALIFLWSGTFEEVLTYTSYGLAVIGAFVVAPIFVLRRRANFQPKFRIPFYPWPPVLFLAVTAWVLVGSAWENPRLSILSVGTILLGFPIYGVVRKAGRRF